FPFHKLQERSAASRDMRHRLGHAEFFDCLSGLATAHNRGCRAIRQSLSDESCAFAEWFVLEFADWPVPDHRPSASDFVGVTLSRFGADVHRFPAVGDVAFDDLGGGGRIGFIRNEAIDGQYDAVTS